MATNLRITVYQQDIEWENKKVNLSSIHDIIAFHSDQSDLIVMPEMCTTGFSMNCQSLAEPDDGETVTLLQEWSKRYDVALCGSFIASEADKYYNRAFFITPHESYFYDKRHLFRMGDEGNFFSSGNKRLIIEHKGFNVCLLVCYDLRFPIWARNVDNEYDLLIYVANWPESRINVWNTLLSARAIENMSYVCGVNRVGVDGNGLKHNGHSKVLNARGEELTSIGYNAPDTETVTIEKEELIKFRDKFPVWKDSDQFSIKI